MEVIRQAQWLIIWEHCKDDWLSFTYYEMGYIFFQKYKLLVHLFKKIAAPLREKWEWQWSAKQCWETAAMVAASKTDSTKCY